MLKSKNCILKMTLLLTHIANFSTGMSLIKPFGSKQASKISPVLFSFISLFPSSEFGHKIRSVLLNLVYEYRLNTVVHQTPPMEAKLPIKAVLE